jgi:hypothetical protein
MLRKSLHSLGAACCKPLLGAEHTAPRQIILHNAINDDAPSHQILLALPQPLQLAQYSTQEY